MLTVDASEAKSDLSELIDQMSLSHESILITGRKSNAVLLAEDDWNAINETLCLTSIPGTRESVLEEMQEGIAEASKSWAIDPLRVINADFGCQNGNNSVCR